MTAFESGSSLCGYPMPHEILTNIFESLSDIMLVKTIPLVCRYWKNLSYDYYFWSSRLKRKNIHLSTARLKRIQNSWSNHSTLAVVQSLCLNKSFQCNLIKNPSGEDGHQFWKFRLSYGDNPFVIIENPPIGSDPIPDKSLLPTQHCFVSSYKLSEKTQKLDLRKLCISSEAINLLQPSIQITEWVSARFDCGSVNNVDILLSAGSKKSSKCFELRWSDANYGRVEWFRMFLEIPYEDLPVNFSQIIYKSSGKDTQFWEGYYGPKTAGSSVSWEDYFCMTKPLPSNLVNSKKIKLRLVIPGSKMSYISTQIAIS